MILLCKTSLDRLKWELSYIPLLAFVEHKGVLRVVIKDIRLPAKIPVTEAQVRYVRLQSLKRFSDGTSRAYVEFLGDSVAEHNGILRYQYDEQTFKLEI